MMKIQNFTDQEKKELLSLLMSQKIHVHPGMDENKISEVVGARYHARKTIITLSGCGKRGENPDFLCSLDFERLGGNLVGICPKGNAVFSKPTVCNHSITEGLIKLVYSG